MDKDSVTQTLEDLLMAELPPLLLAEYDKGFLAGSQTALTAATRSFRDLLNTPGGADMKVSVTDVVETLDEFCRLLEPAFAAGVRISDNFTGSKDDLDVVLNQEADQILREFMKET